MSWSLWVPFVWVTINASRTLANWFSDGTTASQVTDISEGSFYDRNAYLLMMGIGVLILSQRRIEWGRFIHNGRWLIPLFAYYLLSTLWSPEIFISLKRWIKSCGDLIIILIILTESDPIEALRAIFVRSVYVLVPVSVLFIKYYPDLGRYYGYWTYETHYCGITANKNALGLLAMLGGLFLLWQMVDVFRARGHRLNLRTIWPDLLVLAMALWLLHLAGSSTALLCFIVGTAIFFAARLRWVKTNLNNLGWCVLAMGVVMLAFSFSEEFRGMIAGLVGRNATLTDRTLIWEMALKSGSNPLIGSGYEGYWISGLGSEVINEFHVDYAHNAYLDQYLNEGLIGVLLFAGMLFSAGSNATSHFSGGSTFGYLFMGLFWSCLLFNYTEIAFGRSNVFGLLILLMVIIGPCPQSVAEVETPTELRKDEHPEASFARRSKISREPVSPFNRTQAI